MTGIGFESFAGLRWRRHTVSSTGFETDRDLTHEEVERRQQFVDFMNGTR